MFERYTDRARRALVLAQENARMMRHAEIGAEHILLGLVWEDDGVAHRTLAGLGVTLEGAREAVLALRPRGDAEPRGHIPFTAEAKKAVGDLAVREAMELGNNYIATEHLLLALMRPVHGTARETLDLLSLSRDDVRAKVLELLHGYTAQDRPQVTMAAPQTTLDPLGEILERLRRIEAILITDQERRAS